MKHTFEVEIRQADRREPEIHGVILTEGRAASGGRAEVFAPGSVTWPSTGIGISAGHKGPTETRAQPIRQRNGELTIRARATAALRAAVEAGSRFMSVEFVAMEERTTAGGVREVLGAMVTRAALVASPEYDVTAAEIRNKQGRRWWL